MVTLIVVVPAAVIECRKSINHKTLARCLLVCLFAKILQIPVFRLHLRTRSQPGSVVGFDPFLADG